MSTSAASRSAAQDAGCDVLGYTSQARFLMNCGLLDDLRGADVRALAAAQKLLNEHEMGELFKVIAFGRGLPHRSRRSVSRAATARIPCSPDMRWLLVFLIAFVIFNGAARWLQKIGLGRLPGDFRFRMRGRDWYVPLASSVLLSLIAAGVSLVI